MIKDGLNILCRKKFHIRGLIFLLAVIGFIGCPNPTDQGGGSVKPKPTEKREGLFNQDIKLGDDVKSVVNRFGEPVHERVLTEEGAYTVTYTDEKKAVMILDKTAPQLKFVNTSATFDLYQQIPFEDSVPGTAYEDAVFSMCSEEMAILGYSGIDSYVTYSATWQGGKVPTTPGTYVRVYTVTDQAGNTASPFEWPVIVYDSKGNPPFETGSILVEGGNPISEQTTYWFKEISSLTFSLPDCTAGGNPSYSWKVNQQEKSTAATLSLSQSDLKEGAYLITAAVKDEGGQVGWTSVSVVIDLTKPVVKKGPAFVYGYSIEERKNFNETIGLMQIEETGSGVKEIKGEFQPTVPSDQDVQLNQPYTRSVVVTDKAGNVSDPFTYTIIFKGSMQEDDEKNMTGTDATPVSAAGFPTPTPAQIDWMAMGQYAFIHWGPNAFGAGRIGNGEWGNGYPYGAEAFKPTRSADEITQGWINDIVTAGMTGLVFVAKHHDGFCLWDTVTTQYSVCKQGSNYSYYGEDFLKALILNMKQYNESHPEAPLKLGVYVSPWDRNNWTYGGVEQVADGKDFYPYLEYVFRTQITEVIEYVETYGDGKVSLFELWLDGANTPSGWYGGKSYAEHKAEGASVSVEIDPTTKRSKIQTFNEVYDWESKVENPNETMREIELPDDWRDRIYAVAQEVVDSYNTAYSTEVMIFGSQIRWVGNEQGWAGRTNWITGYGVSGEEKNNKVIPAEADMKTQDGWFFTPNEDKGSAKMIEFWYRSVGRNATLLLNFSPDTAGRIPSYNLNSAQKMWETVSSDFADNIAVRVSRITASNIRNNHRNFSPYKVIDGQYDTYWSVDDAAGAGSDQWIQLEFDEAVSFNRVVLQENIAFGQRVRSFTVEYRNGKKDTWKILSYSNMPTTISGDTDDPDITTTIGFKRILRLNTVSATDVRVILKEYRNGEKVPVALSEVGLYYAK